jgi:hypothetical protein
MDFDLREFVHRHQPNFPIRRIGRLVTDTTDFTSIGYGDVIRLGDVHYLVLRDEAERRFSIEDFKFWVKRCTTLETRKPAILKLVFHEEFTQRIGPLSIRSFRSETKEARILDLVRDDPRFMQGFSLRDEAGNLVRILDIIRGKRLDMAIHNLPGTHREYFDTDLYAMLVRFISACEAIKFLHDNGERHGDVRRDHLWLESGTGTARWIDFDYAYEAHANPYALDLFGLGNVLLFITGKQIFTPREFAHMDGADRIVEDDHSLIFRNRLVNLRRLFPYLPEELNRVLMHFAAGSEVFYETVDEFLTDLRPCLDLVPQPKEEA